MSRQSLAVDKANPCRDAADITGPGSDTHGHQSSDLSDLPSPQAAFASTGVGAHGRQLLLLDPGR